MAMVTTTSMVTAMRVADDKEGNGDGSESDGYDDTCGKHATVTRAMARATATHGQ
jgi:hypothetical protein